MQYKFNISATEHFNNVEEAEKNVKAYLNYGWEFVSIEKTKNEDFPYRIVLNWKDSGIPDVPPYSDKLLHLAEER